MKKGIIISDSQFYRRNEATNIINEILADIDNTPDTDWECFSIGASGQWIDDIEYMNHIHVGHAGSLNQLKITGEGTFISAQLSLISRDIIQEMNSGYIITSSEEVRDFLSLLERRGNDLSVYRETKQAIEKIELDIKSLMKDENYRSQKDILQASLVRHKDTMTRLRKALSLGAFTSEYGTNSFFYLMKKAELIASHKSSGLAIFKIRDYFKNNNSFTLRELDFLTESYKNSTEFKYTLEELILKYIKPFEEISIVFEVPFMFEHSLDFVNKEPFINIDLLSSFNMASSAPMAPVKPSIAAAMLASGSGAKLDKEIVINGEPHLLKSAITPIEINETQFIDGMKEESKTFTWEPQLGIFNKLRKEFEILI